MPGIIRNSALVVAIALCASFVVAQARSPTFAARFVAGAECNQ